MNKKLLIGIGAAVLLIALAALAGRYIGYDIGFEKTVENLSNEDIQNWRSYKNEEYNFSFRYPEEWGTVEMSEKNEGRISGTFSNNKDYFVRIHQKDIENVGTDDFILNVRQLIKQDDQVVIKSTGGGEREPDKVFDRQKELCAYESIRLNKVFNTDVDDVEQFLYCSLANSSGIVIIGHAQSSKVRERSIEEDLITISETFKLYK